MLSSHQLDIKRNDFFSPYLLILCPFHLERQQASFSHCFSFLFLAFFLSIHNKTAVVHIYHNPLSGNKEFKAEPWAVKAFNRADRKNADKPKSCVKDSSHVPQTDVSSSVCSL